jgi:hypothetical protein
MNAARTTPRAAKGVLAGAQRPWLIGQAFLLLLCSTLALRGAPSATEGELKAAFLFNFTKFVEWPAEAFSSTNAPIRFAVLGDEDFGTRLKALLVDKKAHGRSFEVETINSGQEAKGFHIVFVPGPESRKALPILEVTNKRPVLTIGESDQFLDQGGIISLFFDEEQLAFDVNAESARKGGLEISSKLLRLAKKRRAK